MKLSFIATLFALWLTLCVAGISAAFFLQHQRQQQAAVLDDVIRVRTEAASQYIVQTLNNDWSALNVLSRRANGLNQSELRGMLEGLHADGQRIAWAGLADANGIVQAGSGGLLEGRDVSDRSWFTAGLQGRHAGDLRNATLLNTLLGGTEASPIRFIDLSAPVHGPDGHPSGVVTVHITERWLISRMKLMEKMLGINLVLLSSDGSVRYGGELALPKSQQLQSLRAAAVGQAITVRETWPDRREYFVTIVPRMTAGTLPDFGWRLLGRIPADARLGSMSPGNPAWKWALTLAGAVILSAWLFARLFLHPVTRLAYFAGQLAEAGHEQAGYPPEEKSSAEAAALSAALVRLKSKVGD